MSNFEAYRQRNEEIYKEYLTLKNDPEKKMSDMEIAIVLSGKVWTCGAEVTYIAEITILKIIKDSKKKAEKISQFIDLYENRATGIEMLTLLKDSFYKISK